MIAVKGWMVFTGVIAVIVSATAWSQGVSAAPPQSAQSSPTTLSASTLTETLASLTPEEWAALPPELRAELEALKPPTWQAGVSAKLAAGWRDNPLLSAVNREERAFVRTQLETFLWRLPKGAWEAMTFLNGDVIRYVQPLPDLAGEQSWFGQAEVRWQPRPGLRASLSTQGYFQDQVIDLSATETERSVARLRVTGAVLGGEVRITPAAPVSLVALTQAHESRYRGFSEDFGEIKLGGRLVWTPHEAWNVTATVLSRVRDYEARPAYTVGGRPLTGTLLSLHQDEAELKVAFTRGRWQTSLTALGLENRDGGSGYFDYDERRGRASIEWKKDPWRLSLEAAAVRYRYRVQTVGIGFDPPRRRRDDVEVTLRAERTLRTRWTWFGEVQGERSRTNEANASYTQTTVMAGLAYTY